jgi:hypothetical protein
MELMGCKIESRHGIGWKFKRWVGGAFWSKVHFHTVLPGSLFSNPTLGKVWKVLQWKMLVFLWLCCLFYGQMVSFMVIWYILRSFGIFCGRFVYFVVVWYIFPILVCCTEQNLATLLPHVQSFRIGFFVAERKGRRQIRSKQLKKEC